MPDPIQPSAENSRVLRLHIAAAACLGTTQAVIAILPFLARQRFDANNWQTTVITAAIPVMQFFSIFWNHFYARAGTPPYLLALALLHSAAIGLIGAAGNIWAVMACFVIAAFGNAGMSPLNADVLRSCYPHNVRGRVFGFISTAQMSSAMLTGLIAGRWLDHNHDAFRLFLPAVAAIQVAGLLLLSRIAGHPLFVNRERGRPTTSEGLLAPFRDMNVVLRADRRFARYEIAFMSYGIGWMICEALLPAIATDKLHLDYGNYTQAKIVLYQLTNIILFSTVGHAVDRVGPMRTATASFLWLTIYPVGLIFITGGAGLKIFCVLYAIGMVGVNLTWTLGPIALAADASRASHYLAIHTTMVGIRGIVAQSLGMAIYSITGSFTIPLSIAAVGFAWAAWRMRELARMPLHAPLVADVTPTDVSAD